MLQSASRRTLAELAVLALCRSSHTSLPRVSQNKPKKKKCFKVQLVLSPNTFTQGEHGPGSFTPATAMISDAQASLTVTGPGQHCLVERLTSVTDTFLLQ